MKNYQQFIVCMTILSSLTVTAQASLFDRGNGMIYDDTLNITWLQDANLAASNQFGIATIDKYDDERGSELGYGIRIDNDDKGSMSWQTAKDWITAMNESGGGNGYKGYNDWRLWSVPDAWNSCYGFNCSDSELGHLFYSDLSGLKGSSILEAGDPDLALFNNIQADEYWSGVTYGSWSSAAWSFWTDDGRQTKNDKASNQFYAWAVRSGDVTDITSTGVAPVPIPAALWLFGSSLLGLATCQRRRIS